MAFAFRLDTLFSWEELHIIEWENMIFIETMKTLNQNQEVSFHDTNKKFQLKIKKELIQVPAEHQSNYYHQIMYSEGIVINELLTQQRYSLCISIFASFESRIKRICYMIEKEIKSDNSDLNLLSKCWRYLDAIFKLNLDSIEHYSFVKQLQTIRNIMAHNDGIPNTAQMQKIKDIKQLSFNYLSGQKIIVEPSFILSSLNAIAEFLRQLLLLIDARFQIISKMQ